MGETGCSVSPPCSVLPVALVKKCRHGRGKQGRARVAAWRACGCGWYADIRVDGLRTYVPLGADEKRARAEHAQLVADREAGRLTVRKVADAGTVDALLDAWLDDVKTSDLKPTSVRNYTARVDVARRWFGGDSAVARIRTADLEEFRDDLFAELSATYAHGVYTTFVGALAWGEARGLCDRITPPPPRRGKRGRGAATPERLTVEEAERTIAAMPAGALRDMAEVALLTGLRRGELLGLTAANVRLDAGLLAVVEQVTELGPSTPKTRSSERVVGLSPRAVELLRDRIDKTPAGGRLFPFHPHYAQQHLRSAMEAAGVYRKRRGWHSFRHANTHLREAAGESIRAAAAALGHGASFARTLSYGWASEAAPSPALDELRARHSARPSRGEGTDGGPGTPPAPETPGDGSRAPHTTNG